MSDAPPEEQPSGYALWAVLRRDPHPTDIANGPTLADEVAGLSGDIRVRGIYDLSGLRADADLMLWLTGPDAPVCRLPCAACAARGNSRRCFPPGMRSACTATPSSAAPTRPRSCGAAAEGVGHRLPVRAQLRLVSASRGGAARDARRSRAQGIASTRGAGEHRRQPSRSATTSGSSRSRRTTRSTSST